VVFGVLSVIVCFRVLGRIERDGARRDPLPPPPPAAQSPFSTGKASTLH